MGILERDTVANKTPLFNLDFDKMRLGMDNKKLSAIICAILDSQGGGVTISAECADTVWEKASLQYTQMEDGGLLIMLVDD